MPDDPRSVSEVIELRDQFGRLNVAKLWPPPADDIYPAYPTSVLAVSGNGKRALIARSGHVWVLDTATMVASSPIELPGDPDIIALNHHGGVALFIADDTLYRWDVDISPPKFQRVWSTPNLGRADVLQVSTDGAIALVASRSRETQVRVIDLSLCTMTFSLQVDADDGLLLHPGGRHFVAFGDDGKARFYGENGMSRPISQCAGGAFSPDGSLFLRNTSKESKEVLLHSIRIEGAHLRLLPPKHLSVPEETKYWDFRAVFSPSGTRVLLESKSDGVILLDLQTEVTSRTHVKFGHGTSFLADETMAMWPSESARPMGVHRDGIAVGRVEPDELLGVITAAAYRQPPVLTAITTIGLYGSLESANQFLVDDTQALPFERPSLLPALLSTGLCKLDRDELQRFDELCARRIAWSPYLSEMTIDIGTRQLMAINRGLVALTPEIVHRAAITAQTARRFGKPKLSLSGLEAAASELLAGSDSMREQAFEAMVKRMRSKAKQESGDSGADAASGRGSGRGSRAQKRARRGSSGAGDVPSPIDLSLLDSLTDDFDLDSFDSEEPQDQDSWQEDEGLEELEIALEDKPLLAGSTDEASEDHALLVAADNSHSDRTRVKLGLLGTAVFGGLVYMVLSNM